mmetsp:Transcript_72739/g.115125  ORF Transcript_72739/g.115125 Transcript_72739/m.115125 type:complete len:271 (+) Transcript_72739:36-848(+)
MAGIWKSRVLSSFGSKTDSKALEALLKRASNKDCMEVEKDALLAIAQSSHSEDDRRIIMRHLHTCLNDVASSKWRCVHAGLTIAEYVLQHGSPDLVTETASGYHFDLVQRLSFLEKFEYSYDKRVESMVRRKALSLRGAWLERQQQIEALGKEVEQRLGPIVWHAEDTDDDLSDTEFDKPINSQMQPKQLQGDSEYLSDSTNDGESSVSSMRPHGPSRRSSPKVAASEDVLPKEELEPNADLLDLLGVQAVNPASNLQKEVDSAGSLLDF